MMGDYTELVMGFSLKSDTDKEIIELLKYKLENDLNKQSEYFGINYSQNTITFDELFDQYIVSIRCSLKNYNHQVQDFIEWIMPHVKSGSGENELLGYYIYEEEESPTLIYKNDAHSRNTSRKEFMDRVNKMKAAEHVSRHRVYVEYR